MAADSEPEEASTQPRTGLGGAGTECDFICQGCLDGEAWTARRRPKEQWLLPSGGVSQSRVPVSGLLIELLGEITVGRKDNEKDTGCWKAGGQLYSQTAEGLALIPCSCSAYDG